MTLHVQPTPTKPQILGTRARLICDHEASLGQRKVMSMSQFEKEEDGFFPRYLHVHVSSPELDLT